jgi:hypothetical protein
VPIRWRALGRAIAEARPAWLCLAGVVASWLIGWFCYWRFSPGCSAAIRYAGTALQILGLLSVALGLYHMRKLFPRRTRGWFGRLVQAFRRPKPVSYQASAEGGLILGGKARVRYRVGPGASLEDRLRVLEGHLEQLEGEMGTEFQDMKEQVTKLQNSLGRETKERSAADDGTARQIEEVAIGGLHLEVVGLVWLILGVLGASIPDEIVRVLSFLGCHAAASIGSALLDPV